MLKIVHDPEGLKTDSETAAATADFAEDEFCSVMEDYRAAWNAYTKNQTEETILELFRATSAVALTLQAISVLTAEQGRKITQALSKTGDTEIAMKLLEVIDALKHSVARRMVDRLNRRTESNEAQIPALTAKVPKGLN